MKVRAKKLGFYDNKRRREGEVFFLKQGHKLSFWMEEVGAAKVEPDEDELVEEPAPKPRGKSKRVGDDREPHAISQHGKSVASDDSDVI